MRFKLIITDSAAADLLGIAAYIARDNAREAVKFHDELVSALQKLETSPFIGNQARIKRLKLLGYRKLVIKNYIAYYTVEEDRKQINVIRVLHGAMEQGKHL